MPTESKRKTALQHSKKFVRGAKISAGILLGKQMKSAGQVAQKAKQVRFRHMKSEIENLMRVCPKNCASHTLVRSLEGSLGICRIDLGTCDSKVSDRSESCGRFVHAHGGEEIKNSLHEFFSTKNPAEIAVRYPDVAALRWVLEDDSVGPEEFGPAPILVGTYHGAKVWVDSETEKETFEAGFEEDSSNLDCLRRNLDDAEISLREREDEKEELEDRVRELESQLLDQKERVSQANSFTEKIETLLRNWLLEQKQVPFWRRLIG